MARIILGLFAAVWGGGIVFFKFDGDGDHLLGESISGADLVILMVGWVLLGIGLYNVWKGFKSYRNP